MNKLKNIVWYYRLIPLSKMLHRVSFYNKWSKSRSPSRYLSEDHRSSSIAPPLKNYKRNKSTTRDFKDLETIPHIKKRIRTLNHEEIIEIMDAIEEEWPSLVE